MAKTRRKPGVKVQVSLEKLASALKEMSDEDRDWFLENLLAATSPEYLTGASKRRERTIVRGAQLLQ